MSYLDCVRSRHWWGLATCVRKSGRYLNRRNELCDSIIRGRPVLSHHSCCVPEYTPDQTFLRLRRTNGKSHHASSSSSALAAAFLSPLGYSSRNFLVVEVVVVEKEVVHQPYPLLQTCAVCLLRLMEGMKITLWVVVVVGVCGQKEKIICIFAFNQAIIYCEFARVARMTMGLIMCSNSFGQASLRGLCHFDVFLDSFTTVHSGLISLQIWKIDKKDGIECVAIHFANGRKWKLVNAAITNDSVEDALLLACSKPLALPRHLSGYFRL